MIGASLDQLSTLQSALASTAAEIDSVNGQSAAVAGAAVDQMAEATLQACTNIAMAMDTLIAAVDASRSELANTDWTGPNRSVFEDHYHTFGQAMASARAETTATFESVQHAIGQINDDLRSYVGVLSQALAAATESAQSMAAAVGSQHDNLESAMSGLTVV